MKRPALFPALLMVFAALPIAGCGDDASKGTRVEGVSADAGAIIEERGLSPDDVTAALKTYVPTGRMDEYVIFSSGGHSGQVMLIGVPSMRLLRVIGVFTPEPWQGWGFGTGEKILAEGQVHGKEIRWGDTHHPALSETAGDYDGQYLFINDKANARIAVIDLRDMETKQIIKNPIAINDHGGTFVTPDTDYVIEGGQYATPLGWTYAPISEYNESYRGMVTLWKFDRERGRVDPGRSFALELPPYWQDLFDAGKLESDGWIFGNSFNTELATGGIEDGNAPFEAGASQRDADYLHIIDKNKAVAVFEAGKVEMINDFPVIPLETLIEEGILYFTPEPKSPHGVDVTPKGDYLVISGKLDPHVTIYSFKKIQDAIAAKNWEPDQYGVPVLDLDAVVEARVEVGLGPLHSQFDEKGYAYTSLFLDSAVARWTLGGPYADGTPEDDWQLVSRIGVHYNVGHIGIAEGDTVSPDGKYLVAFDKWSIDRFLGTGPLLPQNFQLIDISGTGDRMQLLYDMPIGIGEPHYAQIMKADKLKTWEVYPEVGWDPHRQAVDPDAAKFGEERVERNGNRVDVYMTAIRSHYTPEHVEVNVGDHVVWHLTNIESTMDATHGFSLPGYDINLSLEPGEAATIEFDADQAGTYTYYCSEFCSALHLEMMGYFLVKP